jgi:hypothetical protein
MEEDIKKRILSLDQLVELAMETMDEELPWDVVDIKPKQAYSMMAAHVLDMLEGDSQADKEIVMLTVMVRLLVENMFLNLMLGNHRM